MAQATFAFEAPKWRSYQQLHTQTGALLLETGVWLLLYTWLGRRIWLGGMARGLWLNLGLLATCVCLGVVIALGWRTVTVRWWQRLRSIVGSERWRVLNLDQLQQLTPSEFEEYVARRLFERQGYHAVNLPDIKDGGVDVLVRDAQGHEAVVQCKRYRGSVGEGVVRDLYGTMIGKGATHAYLVTSGEITSAARRWAAGKPITLIDGARLMALAAAEAATTDD